MARRLAWLMTPSASALARSISAVSSRNRSCCCLTWMDHEWMGNGLMDGWLIGWMDAWMDESRAIRFSVCRPVRRVLNLDPSTRQVRDQSTEPPSNQPTNQPSSQPTNRAAKLGRTTMVCSCAVVHHLAFSNDSTLHDYHTND